MYNLCTYYILSVYSSMRFNVNHVITTLKKNVFIILKLSLGPFPIKSLNPPYLTITD